MKFEQGTRALITGALLTTGTLAFAGSTGQTVELKIGYIGWFRP